MKGTWIWRPVGDTVVIFIHGVLSNSKAWVHENGTFWPSLLADDQTHIGVYVFEYLTEFFSGTYRLGDVVDELANRLRLDEVLSSRRLIFVCHSMGGIVARRYVVREQSDLTQQLKEIGLFLVASPSLGSAYAKWLGPIARLLKHSQADALRFSQSNSWLMDLDRDFMALKESGRLKLHGKELIEDRFIVPWLFFFTQVVEPFAGARYFGNPYKVPASTHLTIAKVAGPDAMQHRLLLEFLKEFEERFAPVRASAAGRVPIAAAYTAPADPETFQLARGDNAQVALTADIGCGGISIGEMFEPEKIRDSLRTASTDLLLWEKLLPDGSWIERPERETIVARFSLETSSTVLLGEPGSGKSALLSQIAEGLIHESAAVFAIKADFLSARVHTEADLQRELQLSALPSDLIGRLAKLQPVFVLIDQLDALANQLDLRSDRLNVVLNLVRRVGGVPNVHILLSARTFEFNHDVRLRAVGAEAVTLAPPSWHQVKEKLSQVGVNPDGWPEKARDVVCSPQALKTFLGLVNDGTAEPFITYQAMLEKLWRERIALSHDGENLVALASELASHMAEEEALWLAVARFDDRLKLLNQLEALGFILRSKNGLSVSFSHQTVFDYVLARNFVRQVGLLSTYVLERQDSLFVRAKMWSALNYLREAEVSSYERELQTLWQTTGLRRHLRFLLIEFLGQVKQPTELERTYLGEVLASFELKVFGLKAIANSKDWFAYFSNTAIRSAMLGSAEEAGQALRILIANWRAHSDSVVRLIKECWVSIPERDNYSWMAVHECPVWSENVEEIASEILGRTPISVWQVAHTAQIVAIGQPAVAVRLVKAKLEALLVATKGAPEPPPFPENGTEDEKTTWYLKHRSTRHFDELLDAQEWHELPALSEAQPELFLRYLWPWYISVFSGMVARSKSGDTVPHIYPGQYLVEIDFGIEEKRSRSREKPVLVALQACIEQLVKNHPEIFSDWVEQNSKLELLPVQQFIARGFEIGFASLSAKSLDWLLADERRFQLGTQYDLRGSTTALVRAAASQWSSAEVDRFEKAVKSYRPSVPTHLQKPEQRKLFADLVRATRKDLLQAVGRDRLSAESRELVDTEERALGDRFDRFVTEVEGGWIGSPMAAEAMAKAKDRDILKIFGEVPDNTNWDHPRDWMRGGNIPLSREFAQFACAEPERAIRIISLFEPLKQERAAGYALDSMADDAANDARVIGALTALHKRGFQAEEFKQGAARAIEKIGNRNGPLGDETVEILVEWLKVPTSAKNENEDSAFEGKSKADDQDVSEGSILWGGSRSSFLPDGSFTVLSALASILLSQREEGRDRYFSILNDQLTRERDPKVWQALLFRLGNAGGSTPRVVSAFLRKLFGQLPQILATSEAAIFLAYAQRWDDELVFDLIENWSQSDSRFLRRAYGELVGLVTAAKQKDKWVKAKANVLASGNVEAKIGLAHSAVNLWPEAKFREDASATLVSLLSGAPRALTSVVMDIFRVVDDMTPDAPVRALLAKLADPETDLSGAPSNFVVERLQTLLPNEAQTIAVIAHKLVNAWRDELGNVQSNAASAAPQLADLSLTLHRMGGVLRQAGVDVFEAMIEIDAYGARETLAEIDGRFDQRQEAPRRRLRRSTR